MRNTVIFGNWKMNKNKKETLDFIKEVDKLVAKTNTVAGIGVPFIYLDEARKQAKNVNIIAQNCHFEASGAYTGEISIDMLKDINIDTVIIGHSERREYFNDTDADIAKKVKKLIDNNLTPVLCCGETLSQYENKETIAVVKKQLLENLSLIEKNNVEKVIIAYEPIWAIGTGKTATAEIAQNVCKEIRNIISENFGAKIADKVIIQYGGSVKPNNIAELISQPDIDGALVGGASLDPKSFLELL
ncbi:triose-phosphate isomerase [Spiroplasma endosymbiont of Anurida maritima]|uniref:triose-phosphate isomerase n=1 Tax=Spiroplasma endosymbiont of Anurida maritima TaxID=2967972 RepID=UPI0036D38703